MQNLRFNQFEDLKKAVQRFNITSFEITPLRIKQFKKEGLKTDLSDAFYNNEGQLFTVLLDGSMRKSVVHISDISNYQSNYELPRFHIFHCKTLIDMKRNNKAYRYRIAGKEDGSFYLVKKNKTFYEKLDICSNCLDQYNINFNQMETKSNFNLKKYISSPLNKTKHIITDTLDICTIPSNYADNWKEISDYRKKQQKYRCQGCYKDFSQHKKFLHTHHIDANKTNNTHDNLRVLCIECHSNEHNHSHLKAHPQYKEYLKIKGDII